MTAFAAIAITTNPRGDDYVVLKGGETILFFGDSITQAGHYVDAIEAHLIKHHPQKSFTIINHGISSETLSGLSEPDHEPPRPCALHRFTRDVARWKPDVVVACFGMNDGIYHPFSDERFAAFQRGVRSLIDRLHSEAPGAKLVLLTPPPFDAYRRQVGDAEAVHYGYKFPAIDYDNVLARYAAWEMTLAGDGIVVVDLHSALTQRLADVRARKVSDYLAGDGVHPGRAGHELMAAEVLRSVRIAGTDKPDSPDWTEFHEGGRFAALLQRLEARNQRRYEHWRTRIRTELPDDDHDLPPNDEADTRAIRALVKSQ
jgi:lysophospholipase L1-like esterase